MIKVNMIKNLDSVKVLITRELEDGKILAEKLKKLGFEPILFPTIKTIPLNFNTENILDYDVFIFGSRKGVKYFFNKILKNYPIHNFSDKEFIAVGKKTAEELKKLKFSNIKIPKNYSSYGVLNLLKENWENYKDKKILFPKAKRGIDLLEKSLPNIKPLYVYETAFNKPTNIKDVELMFTGEKIDIVIFTSPSTFLGFKEIFNNNWKRYLITTKIVAIGKTTGKTLKEWGITNFYIPKNSTIEDVLKLIKDIG